jgi:hypothetical protein
MEAGKLGGYEAEKLSGCEVKSLCHPTSLRYAPAGRYNPSTLIVGVLWKNRLSPDELHYRRTHMLRVSKGKQGERELYKKILSDRDCVLEELVNIFTMTNMVDFNDAIVFTDFIYNSKSLRTN